jgi:hypothetical protein
MLTDTQIRAYRKRLHSVLTNPAPNISDVAWRAGVSFATVSRVLKRTATVEPLTEEKVRLA